MAEPLAQEGPLQRSGSCLQGGERGFGVVEASSEGEREVAGKRALSAETIPRGPWSAAMSAVQPEGGTRDFEKPEAEGLDHWAPSEPRSHPRFAGGPWAPLVLVLGVRPESHRAGRQVTLHTTQQTAHPRPPPWWSAVESGVKSRLP